ncbi:MULTISPECIES: DUF3263 domain-containing protein [Micromonospora]|uniref:DUF3263 domain-containing protein n=1 Tax=Micromonospora TaxID=1873 RepID=UPI001EE7EAE2|nr:MULTISPECIES: DUF3263 domain-containing protein [Micromonospora]MCG5448357.1 DUF3263 domain-containing protein [Micromonospora hortensis]MCX5120107.1 DUF3263 domain-containing protein [Micromonospora sp. NBC_00362]
MSADTTPAAPEPSIDARPGEVAGAAGPTVPNPRPAPPIETTDELAPPADESAQPTDPADPAAGLTERERAILAFEQQWWRHAGAKEQAVRDTFGISSTRYYQLLNGLLDNPAALAADPVLISRLRRLRSSRARNRRR